MPIDLATLLEPRRCALLNSELQNGTVGPDSPLPQLAEAAQVEAVPNAARLVAAARSAGVPVVHCLAGRRPDGWGANTNGRLFAAVTKTGRQLTVGTRAVDVVPELAPEPADVVVQRLQGLNPFANTELDAVLRNAGVTTVVPVGVSVNVAVTNLVMDAVNRGYQVVLPRDAVAGVPKDYADAVIDNTLALLATVVTTAEVAKAWSG